MYIKFHANRCKNARCASIFPIFQLHAARTTLIFVIEYQMSAMAYSLCTTSFMAIGQRMRAPRAFFRFFQL